MWEPSGGTYRCISDATRSMWSFISSLFFSMTLPFNPRFSEGAALGPKAVFCTLPSGPNWHCDCFVDFPSPLKSVSLVSVHVYWCSAPRFCATDSFKAAEPRRKSLERALEKQSVGSHDSFRRVTDLDNGRLESVPSSQAMKPWHSALPLVPSMNASQLRLCVLTTSWSEVESS
jgi:hypothetical protein